MGSVARFKFVESIKKWPQVILAILGVLYKQPKLFHEGGPLSIKHSKAFMHVFLDFARIVMRCFVAIVTDALILSLAGLVHAHNGANLLVCRADRVLVTIVSNRC